jgi:hypothetical protein
MPEEFEDESRLFRATIKAMPGNPAAGRCGVQTGLWYVAIFKRRVVCCGERRLRANGSD